MAPPNPVKVGDLEIGRDRSLTLIAGPCVMEPGDMTLRIARRLVEICEDLAVPSDLQGVVRQGQPDVRIELSRSRAGRGDENLRTGQGRDRLAGDHRPP